MCGITGCNNTNVTSMQDSIRSLLGPSEAVRSRYSSLDAWRLKKPYFMTSLNFISLYDLNDVQDIPHGFKLQTFDFIGKHIIKECNILVFSIYAVVVQRCSNFLDIHQQGRYLEDVGITQIHLEISIIQSITGLSTPKSGSISTYLCYQFIDGFEVAQLLGHLLSIDQDVAVTEVRFRPFIWMIPPYRLNDDINSIHND